VAGGGGGGGVTLVTETVATFEVALAPEASVTMSSNDQVPRGVDDEVVKV